MLDYIACGYPDLSYHGEEAWKLKTDRLSRFAGVMYCGNYALKNRNEADSSFYIAYNMHWEPHAFALPGLPEGQEWIMDMVNNVLIEVLASIAEQERREIKERQAEGIAAAKKKGKSLGRPEIGYPANWEAVYARWRERRMTAVKAAGELGVKRSTFYNLVRKWENRN